MIPKSMSKVVIGLAFAASTSAAAHGSSLDNRIGGFDVAGVKLSQSCRSAIIALAKSGWRENDDGSYIAFQKPYEALTLRCIQAPTGSLVNWIQYVAQEALISPAEMRAMVVRKYGPPEFVGLAYPTDAEVLAWGRIDHPDAYRPQFASVNGSAAATLVSYFASPDFTQKANILRLSAGRNWEQIQAEGTAAAKTSAIRRTYKPSFASGLMDDETTPPACSSQEANQTLNCQAIPKEK